ncbi:MAG: glycosyltransferase family 2 protein [Aeromicrobium sp.]|uniref:glycosyltransferase family A protein n=1 Tax=Aeromicrobium sp. TaxID=1871063 RepID=UPI002639DFB4|nr:glycosyltransferase family A protein [Aeromicrobium sp.]MCW2789727.1 glycosyltransferase family 2 protein [Aeromicrobium sp.]MCW2826156.1 glycosyltransferase family 2 protein [Aeromicrobium sp.]
MLAFITSLRHPKNAKDYAEVESLLRDTLRSVTGQTSDDFVVIVVGNRAPSFPLPERVHFVEVNYPAPAPRNVRISRSPFIRDKGTKIGIGLIAARQFSPDYVMIFDADDFVHRGLAEFVGKNPGQDGWVIEEGWMYSRARSAVRPQPNFNRTCGTSFIIPFEAYGVPPELDVTATRSEVRAAYGERISKIIGAHKWADKWFADRGMHVQTLPFKGAVYHVDTGENHSRNVMSGKARPLSSELAAEFGIRPVRGRLRTYWACYASEPMASLDERLNPLTSPIARLIKRVYRGVRRRVRRAS